MPLVIIILAAALIAAGIRDTWKQLGTLIVGDFTGTNNFFGWIIAVGLVGVVGYVPVMQKWSRLFLALILVAIFVKNGDGLFSRFTSALEGATAGTAVTPPGQTITLGSSGSSASGVPQATNALGGSQGILSEVESTAIGATGQSVSQATGISSGLISGATQLFNTTGTSQGATGNAFSPGVASGNDIPTSTAGATGSGAGSTATPTQAPLSTVVQQSLTNRAWSAMTSMFK